jgi:hypothetical protein
VDKYVRFNIKIARTGYNRPIGALRKENGMFIVKSQSAVVAIENEFTMYAVEGLKQYNSDLYPKPVPVAQIVINNIPIVEYGGGRRAQEEMTAIYHAFVQYAKDKYEHGESSPTEYKVDGKDKDYKSIENETVTKHRGMMEETLEEQGEVVK